MIGTVAQHLARQRTPEFTRELRARLKARRAYVKAQRQQQSIADLELDALGVPDAQLRQRVLQRLDNGDRVDVVDLKWDLHIPMEKLRQLLQELLDAGEIISDPREGPIHIPMFRKADSWGVA